MARNYEHFKRRLKERYNQNISYEEYEELNEFIRGGRAFKYLVRGESNNRRVYRLPIQGAIVEVGYRKGFGILTALPK